ncbi:MAG: hypothetical protein II535_02710 [Bacteroidales bacterium]|nr:hypothetical protein [Bacteroidales bacterium]
MAFMQAHSIVWRHASHGSSGGAKKPAAPSAAQNIRPRGEVISTAARPQRGL